jgi:hypothetical protein
MQFGRPSNVQFLSGRFSRSRLRKREVWQRQQVHLFKASGKVVGNNDQITYFSRGNYQSAQKSAESA